MKAMEKLAVQRQNVLLNVVNFLLMGQGEGEPIKNYLARLRGQAAVCGFQLPEGERDYTSRMIKHQLVRGVSDREVQEHVFAHYAAQSVEPDLEATVVVMEAKESGKRDTDRLSRKEGGDLNRLASDYKRGR